jgi:2-methylfumaryl-CoA isomerase
MGWADGAPAVDYTVNAAVGLPLMTGPVHDLRPVNHVLPAWDLLTGAYAAFSLVSALLARRATGEGREIRIPLSDIAGSTVANLGMLAEAQLAGRQRPRVGNDLFGAFGRDFMTRDGRRVMVVAITPRQWKGLLEVLGLAEPVAALETELGVGFGRDEGARFTHRARLAPLFDQAFAHKDLAELTPVFDSLGVCWGIYQPLETAIADPRLFAGNPVFDEIRHPSGERYIAPGAAATLPQDDRAPVRPAPRLGENTEEVLAELLGLDSGEIARLHDQGVVASAGAKGRP